MTRALFVYVCVPAFTIVFIRGGIFGEQTVLSQRDSSPCAIFLNHWPRFTIVSWVCVGGCFILDVYKRFSFCINFFGYHVLAIPAIRINPINLIWLITNFTWCVGSPYRWGGQGLGGRVLALRSEKAVRWCPTLAVSTFNWPWERSRNPNCSKGAKGVCGRLMLMVDCVWMGKCDKSVKFFEESVALKSLT